jgi:hypothetical protein
MAMKDIRSASFHHTDKPILSAAAFGTRKPMLITSTKARMLIILSLVAALVDGLIARYPFVAAARSPL